MVKLTFNGKEYALDVPEDTPLLWVIREEIGFTGTKFGCGMGLCGACTVHLDGSPIRSCITPVSATHNLSVTTIEGLSPTGDLTPLQKAWIAANVPQCGYCQSGQIMAAEALLKQSPSPTDEEITTAMAGNICRCGTYSRIRQAIRAVAPMAPKQAETEDPHHD